jgi:hypothetical protein
VPIIIGRPNGTSGGSDGTPSPEQEARLSSIESVNTQQDTKLDSIQAKDAEQDSQLSSLNSKVDAAVATTTSQAERISTLENNYVDYAPTIHDIQTKNTEQDGAITLANGKNDIQDLRLDDAESLLSSQASRLTTAESTLATKADLVSGKIPLSQLPDLPVGRKVSVADKAERLGLAVHPDLTIAYESDTADAWALDAGEDPSIEANWDKLGNAQATGVQSFNGRTGNVAPTTGDYTTAQITTSSDRAFISDADRVRWDNKSTPTSVEAAVSGLRTEVEAGYIKTSTRGVVNGTATLGTDGKVPTAQLPPLGLTTLQSQRIDQIESLARLADAKGDSAATNILAVDNRLTQVDNDSKSRDTAQNTRLTALETASANHIPTSQRGAVNGVAPLNASSQVPLVNLPVNIPNGIAPLGSAGKVPAANLLTNVSGGVALLDVNNRIPSTYVYRDGANGLAPLDADRKVPLTNLPTFMPSRARAWRNVKGSRVVGTYYTVSGGNDLTVFVRASTSTDVQRYLQILVRENASSPTFDFRCDVFGAAGNRWVQLTVIVPSGWQYSLTSTGGSTTANTEFWYEFS